VRLPEQVELKKFSIPEFVYGSGASRLCGRYASKFGVSRVLVVSDPGVSAAGHAAPVAESLRAEGIAFELFTGISPNPRSAEVRRGVEAYLSSGCDAVVALGGNGLEALEAIASGALPPDAGEVLALGRPLASIPGRELRTSLMAYLPTDREGAGLCGKASVGLNAIASRLFDYSFLDFALGARPLADAERIVDSLGVRAWRRRRVDTLSGGNRQRVVAARELEGSPPIIVAANPTQGLDAAARAVLLARLAELRDGGSAVLLLSSDPDDAASLADRSFALYRGGLSPLEPGRASVSAALTGAAR